MTELPRETVQERLEQLDGELLRVAVTRQRNQTVYALATRLLEQHGRETVDVRTVVVDLGDDSVRVTDNGLWVPADDDVLGQLQETVGNAAGHVENGTAGLGLSHGSAVDGLDAGLLLERELAPDATPESVHGWGSTWGNGQGPPDDVHGLVDRLEQAGLETERFSRLDFGAKTPWERYANRPAEEMLGNYGVETLEGDPLVVVDVDAPEQAPVEELPETYRVSSPHGDDDRAHHYLAVDDVQAVVDHFGKGGVQPGWGEIWLQGEYVVGPGSVLTSCKKDGCDVCSGPGGRYAVDDRPITEVSADWLIDLLERTDVTGSDDDQEADDQADPADLAAPVDDDSDDDQADCADCGATVDLADAELVDRDGSPVYVCGGCA